MKNSTRLEIFIVVSFAALALFSMWVSSMKKNPKWPIRQIKVQMKDGGWIEAEEAEKDVWVEAPSAKWEKCWVRKPDDCGIWVSSSSTVNHRTTVLMRRKAWK